MPRLSETKGLDIYYGTDTTMTFNGRSFPKRYGIDVQLFEYNGNSNQNWEFIPDDIVYTYNNSYVVRQAFLTELALIPVSQTVKVYCQGNTIYKLQHSASAKQCNQTESILGENKITLQHSYFDLYGTIARDAQYTSQNSSLIYEEYAYFTAVLQNSFARQNGTIVFRGTAQNSSISSAPPGFFSFNLNTIPM